MADTVAQVMTEAKALLNDINGVFYTNTALLPYLNKAYRELQNVMNLHGLKNTVDVSATLTVTAGSTTIAAPPADMLRPIELAERTPGSGDQFTPMDERSWEPEDEQSTSLGVWTWREETIYLLGATQDREVRIRYVKSLSVLSGDGSIIAITNALTVLAARTAALAARFIGENPSRADELDTETGFSLDTFIVTAVRQNQGMPTRRRRTRYRVPN